LPLPITAPQVSRYFMTIKEAVLLVIEAMVLGEPGATYILEMGEPVPIIELARNLLALSGYDPENGDEGPGVVITGLRPGEKLHESLVEKDEAVEPSPNPLIRKALHGRPPPLGGREILARLEPLARAGDRAALRAELFRLVGTAQPAPGGGSAS
jgi:O-antigen biosynthesis protein WbqV